jgi:hypothetical protein
MKIHHKPNHYRAWSEPESGFGFLFDQSRRLSWSSDKFKSKSWSMDQYHSFDSGLGVHIGLGISYQSINMY